MSTTSTIMYYNTANRGAYEYHTTDCTVPYVCMYVTCIVLCVYMLHVTCYCVCVCVVVIQCTLNVWMSIVTTECI